jgi:hypothetical protein
LSCEATSRPWTLLRPGCSYCGTRASEPTRGGYGYERTISPNHDDDTWLHNTRDMPRVETLVHVVAPAGDAWIVLESHVTWGLQAEDGGT